MTKTAPIEVTWAGQKYALRLPADLAPLELVAQYKQLQAILRQSNEYKSQPPSEEQAKALEDAIERILRLVGPDLLAADPPLPFQVKLKVLAVYAERIALTGAGRQKQRHP